MRYRNGHSSVGQAQVAEESRGVDPAGGASANLVLLPASGPQKRNCKSQSGKAVCSPCKESWLLVEQVESQVAGHGRQTAGSLEGIRSVEAYHLARIPYSAYLGTRRELGQMPALGTIRE